jgi:RNA polymerase sigma factor (sigma-70 family)
LQILRWHNTRSVQFEDLKNDRRRRHCTFRLTIARLRGASGAGGHPVRRKETSKTPLARRFRGPDVTWSDARLIRACLSGNELAWSALIGKYKNLIYSIPVKYGASPEEAADIFQSVCLELFSELPRLREIAAFRSWLITVTAHQSFHWKRKVRRRAEDELTPQDEEKLGVEPAPDLIEQVEREQMLREAVVQLPPRCQEMIKLLFFQQPQMSYRDVAQRLGLATGSIGFIRGRCLKRLQRVLEESGF